MKNEEYPSKKEQLVNSLEQELARYSTNARKQDTRRKILLGAFLLKKMNSDPNYKSKVMKELSLYLDKPNDRKLFDFDE